MTRAFRMAQYCYNLYQPYSITCPRLLHSIARALALADTSPVNRHGHVILGFRRTDFHGQLQLLRRCLLSLLSRRCCCCLNVLHHLPPTCHICQGWIRKF